MANILRLPQVETNDILVKPLVQNSNLYSAIGFNDDGSPAGNAPIGVAQGVSNGGNLRILEMPFDVMQIAPTDAERKALTYQPKKTFSVTSKTWSLQEYGLAFTITQKQVESLTGQINVASGADGAAAAIESKVFKLLQDGVRRSVTTYAFHSKAGQNFATTYPSNTWASTDTSTNLGLKDGFMEQIQDLVTAETIFNFDTALLDGDPLSNEDVTDLLNEVVNGAGPALTQLMDSDLDIQQKPVFIVSASVYNAYQNVLSAQGSSSAMYFKGFDAEGRILPTIRALQYRNCLIIAASEAFELWASVSAGVKNKHFAILTSRDNLRIAFNYPENGDGLAMETFGIQAGGWAVVASLFPRMDYKIAITTSDGLSVAGFTAPE